MRRARNSTASGRVLYHAKDIWPRFISCVLVVTEKLIAERPDVVRDLVRGIAESGEWAERHRVEAAALVSPYFRQDEKLVRYVLTQPPDRVSYRMLTPLDEEMQQIADMGLAAGILERRLDVQGSGRPPVHSRRHPAGEDRRTSAGTLSAAHAVALDIPAFAAFAALRHFTTSGAEGTPLVVASTPPAAA